MFPTLMFILGRTYFIKRRKNYLDFKQVMSSKLSNSFSILDTYTNLLTEYVTLELSWVIENVKICSLLTVNANIAVVPHILS